jgi:hypothetical protein
MTIKMPQAPALRDLVITADGVLSLDYKSNNGEDWPEDTTSVINITDRAGAPLASLEGDIVGNKIKYRVLPADLADIEAGANYDWIVTLPDDDYGDLPWKIRLGRVVRKENIYPLNPLNVSTYQALEFSGSYPSTQSLKEYVLRHGKIKILDNSGSLPNGLGPNFPLLWQNAACLYYHPFNGDSIRWNVTIVTGTGRTRFALCSNYEMTNYLAVEFDTTPGGTGNDKIAIGTGTGPIDITIQTEYATNTFENLQNYTFEYNSLTNVLAVYKGNDLTPILEWEDETNIVQHGEGHRYFGFAWRGSLLDDGVQPTAWIIRDDP